MNKSIYVLFLRIFGVLLFFSLTLFITNKFESELVGKYDFSRSFLMFFGALTMLGMHQSIIYYSGVLEAKRNLGYIRTIYLKMVLILFISCLLIFTTFSFLNKELINAFFNKNVYTIVYKSILCLFFYGLVLLNIETLRGINKILESEILRNVFRYLFFFLFVIFLVFQEKHQYLVDAFLINFILLSFFTTGITLYFFFKKFKGQKVSFKNKIGFDSILKRSTPMAISSIAFILMQSIDVILLGKFVDFSAVAFYSIAVKLTMIISIVLASVNAVFAPKISELFSLGDDLNLKANIKKATRLIFVLTLPAIVFITVFSNKILAFFGDEYIIAQTALYILIIGQVVNAFCGSVGTYMNMTGKQNALQIFLIIALFINVILNWILIPKYSFNGAAIATSISMVIWNIGGVIYIYREDKIKTYLN